MRASFRSLTAREQAAFIGRYLFMGLCSLVALFPIVWVIMSSFKTNAEILSSGIGLPSSLSPDGYIAALTISPILKYFANSVIITVITTVLNVLFLAMAAYVFARSRFRGKNLLYFILSLSLVMPTTALLQPVYSVVNTMGLYDTKMGLILVYTAINMPMSLLILRGTFQSIPRALEEAAYLDGAGFLRTFFQIMMPCAKGGADLRGGSDVFELLERVHLRADAHQWAGCPNAPPLPELFHRAVQL